MALSLAVASFDFVGRLAKDVKEKYAEEQAEKIKDNLKKVVVLEFSKAINLADSTGNAVSYQLQQAEKKEANRGGAGPASRAYVKLLNGGNYEETNNLGSELELIFDNYESTNGEIAGVRKEKDNYLKKINMAKDEIIKMAEEKFTEENIDEPVDLLKAQKDLTKIINKVVGKMNLNAEEMAKIFEDYEKLAKKIKDKASKKYGSDLEFNLGFEMEKVNTDKMLEILSQKFPEIKTKSPLGYYEELTEIVGPEKAKGILWKALVWALLADILPYIVIVGISAKTLKDRKTRYEKGKKILVEISEYVYEFFNNSGVKEFLQKINADLDLNQDEVQDLLLNIAKNSDTKLAKFRDNRVIKFLKMISGSYYTEKELEVASFVKTIATEKKRNEFLTKVVNRLFPLNVNDLSEISLTKAMVENSKETAEEAIENQKEERKKVLSEISNLDDVLKNLEKMSEDMKQKLTSLDEEKESEFIESGKKIQKNIGRIYAYLKLENSGVVFKNFNEFSQFLSGLKNEFTDFRYKLNEKKMAKLKDMLDGNSHLKNGDGGVLEENDEGLFLD